MSHNGAVFGRRRRQRESKSHDWLHVVIAGGTPTAWRSRSDEVWDKVFLDVAEAARADGIGAVSFVPLTGEEGWDFSLHREVMGIVITAESRRDGRSRIVEALKNWPAGVRVDEESLGRAIRGVSGEPDLVVVCSEVERLPETLVWELAYAELVYVGTRWEDFGGRDLGDSMAEFRERERRFGGVDHSASS
jgi:hypothetical protein